MRPQFAQKLIHTQVVSAPSRALGPYIRTPRASFHFFSLELDLTVHGLRLCLAIIVQMVDR